MRIIPNRPGSVGGPVENQQARDASLAKASDYMTSGLRTQSARPPTKVGYPGWLPDYRMRPPYWPPTRWLRTKGVPYSWESYIGYRKWHLVPNANEWSYAFPLKANAFILRGQPARYIGFSSSVNCQLLKPPSKTLGQLPTIPDAQTPDAGARKGTRFPLRDLVPTSQSTGNRPVRAVENVRW